MKNYKGLIIALVIILLYGIIMFFVFGNPSEVINSNKQEESKETNNKIEKEDTKRYYLVIDNLGMFEYYDKKFINTTSGRIENVNSLNVFVNNKYIGDYKLRLAAKWNLLDENNNYKSYKGNLIAASKIMNLEVKEFKLRKMNDDDKILLMNKYNINNFNYLSTNEVVDIDLDNNGIVDEIICLSSLEDSPSINNYYNIIIVKFNNEVFTVLDERGENAHDLYSIYGILSTVISNSNTIVLQKTVNPNGENPKESAVLVNYKNNNYTID